MAAATSTGLLEREVTVAGATLIAGSGAAWRLIARGLVLLLLVGLLGGCARQVAINDQGKDHMAPVKIEEVLEKHTDEWLAIPGVVGAAIGESKGRRCIQILIVRTTRELSTRIPSQVDGYPVVIKETGEFRALETE